MWLLAKNLLFTVVVPGTVAVYVPLWLARGGSASAGSVAAAIPLFLVGGALYAWCVWDFARFGRGTPAPIDAPTRLVVRGPYRLVRNPMYVAVLTVILGWAVLFRSTALAAYALVVAALFHLFVLLYEEPRLRREFGREYDDYCARAGRWLPRL
jgi:protein-S-isoprenylcysteine O-methyltransferase Ste14